jgi:hypothetical protein
LPESPSLEFASVSLPVPALRHVEVLLVRRGTGQISFPKQRRALLGVHEWLAMSIDTKLYPRTRGQELILRNDLKPGGERMSLVPGGWRSNCRESKNAAQVDSTPPTSRLRDCWWYAESPGKALLTAR